MKLISSDFSTAFPDAWEDRTMVTLVAPFTPGSFASNVVITKHDIETGASLENFAQEQLQLLQTSLPNYELLDQRLTTVNDYPAYQLLHRFQSEHGILQQVQAFLLSGAKIFAITGTARIEEFDGNIEAFRQVVENFRAT